MRRLVLAVLSLSTACAEVKPEFRPRKLATATAEALRDPYSPPEPILQSIDEIPPLLVSPVPVGDIVFTPSDMSTATYQTSPTIAVRQRGLTAAQVAAIAGQFELVTWPERVPVETTAQYLDEGIVTAEFSRIVLRPSHPLAARWYAIRGVVPGGQTPPSPQDVPLDFDGKFVSRFLVASQPGLARVVAAARPASTGGDIELDYSERVRDPAVHGHVQVHVDGRHDTSCRVGNRADLSSDVGTRVVWLACDGIAAGSHLSITHFRPMSSATGSGIVTAPDGSDLGTIELTLPVAPMAARGSSAPPLVPETYVPPYGLSGAGP